MTNNHQKEILIVKASGEVEPFSDTKLRRSLERVKASPDVIETIIEHMRKELKPNMPTSQIYRHAFSLLKKQDRPIASRYALKQAIRELGPSGHPFEKLIGEMLASEGFSVEVSKIVQGSCVSHEVDVVAQKDNRHIMVECKFHNQPGIKSDVKIALYIEARFQDVEKAWQKNPSHTEKFHEAWLITNTKLTSDAIRYAECVGMKAIGWSYPAEESLESRIDRSGLHPITCLTTLSSSQKRQLIEKGIVLCKELLSKDALRSLGLQEAKVSAVVNEAEQLCRKK
ncbi:MAG: ATPase [Candidatus Wildermuthbacteria bacterium RIFCSPHIGHO2_01_FULL_48_25]|nr:MAG: ATPase [Candidatus Wildermuthbacteria bacterium RIFCSPHIGHO2_01_FULL_48_25]